MTSERYIIPGIVKDGVAVPQNNTSLPEGIPVEIHVRPADLTPELQSEMKRWDKASDEAWAMTE